ncbi:MAG: M56 family metallopeptidase [Gemmatimonadota bacterium]
MIVSVLFAALVALAAFAAEHALRVLRRPTRAPWVVALAVAVVWPLVAPVASRLMPVEPEPVAAVSLQPAWIIGGELATAATAWTERVDNVAVWLWALASGALLLQVLLATSALRRARNGATPHVIDGEPVLVTESLGPAVVGLRNPRIVVPEWLLELDAPLRDLVLRHEREHCRAGDARLVWMGVFATALVPWNPVVWFMTRRLRLAMEIDYDARTLRGTDSHQQYGKLLLLIAGRQSSARLVPMLAESSSNLARRIAAMRQTNPGYRGPRAIALGAVAVGAVLVACSPRIAGNLSGMTGPVPEPVAVDPASAKQAPRQVGPNEPLTAEQVERPAVVAPGTRGPDYPKALREAGVEGTVFTRYVVKADGYIDTSTVTIRSSDDKQFEESVRAFLPKIRYLPATVGNKPVPQIVELPFQFYINRSVASPASAARIPNAVTTVVSPGTSARAQSASAPGAPVANGAQRMLPGSSGPAYPADLRSAGIEGRVLVQFVLNADGTPDMNTLKVLKTDHAGFEQAVRDALPKMRFEPATVEGKAVRQLLQYPFQFSLNR